MSQANHGCRADADGPPGRGAKPGPTCPGSGLYTQTAPSAAPRLITAPVSQPGPPPPITTVHGALSSATRRGAVTRTLVVNPRTQPASKPRTLTDRETRALGPITNVTSTAAAQTTSLRPPPPDRPRINDVPQPPTRGPTTGTIRFHSKPSGTSPLFSTFAAGPAARPSTVVAQTAHPGPNRPRGLSQLPGLGLQTAPPPTHHHP